MLTVSRRGLLASGTKPRVPAVSRNWQTVSKATVISGQDAVARPGRLSKTTARKGFWWNTGGSDTRSALGSSETNGPCPFTPPTSKAPEKSSPAPGSERSCAKHSQER